MKKALIFIALIAATIGFTHAQKYAYVDTEYILGNIPTYEAAQSELDELSKKWQKEVEAQFKEVEEMYKKFQTDKVILSDEMKRKREEAIITKENDARALKTKYFGREGMLFKKRTELITPIQDEVYNAVKEVATEGNYAFIFDISGNLNVLYTDPKYDKSNDVLDKLGYKVD